MSNKNLLNSRLEGFTGNLVLPVEIRDIDAFIQDVSRTEANYGLQVTMMWRLGEDIEPLQSWGTPLSEYIASLLLILRVLRGYGRGFFGRTHFTYTTTDFAAGTITVQDNAEIMLIESYTHGEIEIERYTPNDLDDENNWKQDRFKRKRWLIVRNE